MRSTSDYEMKRADFLIIGSGVAGLRAAIEMAPFGSVLIVSKGLPSGGATHFAQGGIAVAMEEEDHWTAHQEDTLKAGRGLCGPRAVEILTKEGRGRVQELIDWGAHFDREGDDYLLAREGAHGRARILRSGGDATGAEILRALFNKAKALPSVLFLHDHFSVDLLMADESCIGAILLQGNHPRPIVVIARGVLLATGGAGQVYSRTTNPPGATGDGVVMAYRAGAVITDMEFVQFHPTALNLSGAPSLLMTEAMRGEGARLLNEKREPFMSRYDVDMELAPRDIVARAILEEMRQTGSTHVYLDITHHDKKYLEKRFPTIFKTCLEYGLDISSEVIPISPSAHFMIGGVQTDLDGSTSISGFFAAGEAAACGVHGANRLASNSLLEGLVFGARAGTRMRKFHPPTEPNEAPLRKLILDGLKKGGTNFQDAIVKKDRITLAEAVWKHVGIIRSEASLTEALGLLDRWKDVPNDGKMTPPTIEFRNLVQGARLIAEGALKRKESRGVHFRSDYPDEDRSWQGRHILLSKDQ